MTYNWHNLHFRIVLEERSDDSKLHLVCDVKSQVDKACPAQIFLISGHTSCSGLPDIVSAKKLADVESNGQESDGQWVF